MSFFYHVVDTKIGQRIIEINYHHVDFKVHLFWKKIHLKMIVTT